MNYNFFRVCIGSRLGMWRLSNDKVDDECVCHIQEPSEI